MHFLTRCIYQLYYVNGTQHLDAFSTDNKVLFLSWHSHDVYNLTDGCANQLRAGCNWQFSLNFSYGMSWAGKYYRKLGTDERKIKWSFSLSLTEKGLSSVAHNVISCLVINHSSDLDFIWDTILQTSRSKYRNFGWAYAKILPQKLCRLLCCCFLVMLTWSTGMTLTLSRTHRRIKFLCHTRSYLIRRS